MVPVKGRFVVTAPPEDEIPVEEADMLDRYLPADAANTIRKMIRRANRLNPWIQNFTDDFQAAKTAIQNHDNRLDTQRDALLLAEAALAAANDEIVTLKSQATQAGNAIQNIRARLTAAGIP